MTLLALGFLLLLALATALRSLDWAAVKLVTNVLHPPGLRERRNRFRSYEAVLSFRQHFSAIAADGPIAGPNIACQAFGWFPLLWIGLGVVLIGRRHDFAALAASVRTRNIDRRDRARTLGTGAGRA